MSERSLTQQLATAISGVSADDLLPEDVAFTRLFVLDWLASAIAGTATPVGEMLIAEGRSRGKGSCGVFGMPDRRDAEVAALINGGLSHIVEMDDLDRGSVVHPGTVVIPAALAAAESIGATGRRFVFGVIAGYEVAIRVGEAVGRSHYRMWQNTATCGAFGAAAGAAVVLGLTSEQITWALGNAGSIASGLWQFNHDGAMTKHLHAGRAAANGLLSAYLSARGFTGARDILEGPQGFFAAMSSDANPVKVVDGLERGFGPDGVPWKIGGVSIKPHASCRHTHPAVDAALSLRNSVDVSVDSIRRVRVETYGTALQVTDAPNPTNAYQAKFSLQYCTAHALLHGRVSLHDFSSSHLDDETIRRLIDRVDISIDPEFDAIYPQVWSARVIVDYTDGSSRQVVVDAPKGDPENPVTWNEVVVKTRNLAVGTRYESIVDEVIDRVVALDERSSMSGFLPSHD